MRPVRKLRKFDVKFRKKQTGGNNEINLIQYGVLY